MKATNRKQLATLAGVSVRTIQQWIQREIRELVEWEFIKHSHILPPAFVEHICKKYGIEMPE